MDTPTLSHIAHELRTPLTLIHSRLQLIEAEQPQIKLQKNWIQLTENIRDMGDLISQLTESAAKNLPSADTLDFHQLLLELIDDFLLQANSDNLTISLTISPEALPFVTAFSGNRIHLKQIFTNLIKNALEATDRLPIRQVGLHLFLVSSVLCICVRDNGPGIPADILPRLYMPYVTGKSHGTGIGLTITRQLVQEHGGWLEAENSTDGAEFRVCLPLR